MAPDQDTRTSGEIAGDAPKQILGNPVIARNDPDAKRAESRGVYVDGSGDRRVVAAGDPIPKGWEREGDAPIDERAAATETAQDAPAATSKGGARSPSKAKPSGGSSS